MRLGSLLRDACTMATVFKANFTNKSGTCNHFMWSVLLIIKYKFLIKIPKGQESTA